MPAFDPLRAGFNFGLAEHVYRRHAMMVPASYLPHLENPDLYVHVLKSIAMFDEIRCVADDGSWIALVFVTHAGDGRIRTKVLWHIPLEAVDPKDTKQTRFVVKQRGNLKWCVIDTAEGDKVVRQGLHTESEAMKQLEEHLRALNR